MLLSGSRRLAGRLYEGMDWVAFTSFPIRIKYPSDQYRGRGISTSFPMLGLCRPCGLPHAHSPSLLHAGMVCVVSALAWRPSPAGQQVFCFHPDKCKGGPTNNPLPVCFVICFALEDSWTTLTRPQVADRAKRVDRRIPM